MKTENHISSSNNNPISVHKRQSGFSLIEVMVAALVLAVGVLGVASLQVLGLKGTHQSYMKTQAMSIVRDVTERMHANKLAVIRDHYLVDSTSFTCGEAPAACNTVNASCTYIQMAELDLDNIICGRKTGTAPRINGVKAVEAGDRPSLLDGELEITCPNGCDTGEVMINLQWQERSLSKSAADEVPEKDSLVVSTRIIK